MYIKKNVVIIGGGELGSRHLQGVLKYKEELLKIFLVDPSEKSLELSRLRSLEIIHNHELLFVPNIEEIPQSFDLAIVATSAHVREAIVDTLLSTRSLRYLILEKILFQNIPAYEKIQKLILQHNIQVWVNHPRRMYTHYKAIKSDLNTDPGKVVYTVFGTNWGLGCNSLHFLDLFSYLSNSPVAELNGEQIENHILPSKRPGNVEFSGSIKGSLSNGDLFMLTDLNGESSPITFNINSATRRWTVQEGQGAEIISSNAMNGFRSSVGSIGNYYQSNLTTDLLMQIFSSGNCELPSYANACLSHVPFLELLLEKYKDISGIDTGSCPIT